MKIVINSVYSGFCTSPLAVKTLAELNGRECHFYKSYYEDGVLLYSEVSMEDVSRYDNYMAFDCKSATKDDIDDYDWYKAHQLEIRDLDRSDPKLIEVVEKLGAEANGLDANLKIVEIPDGVLWEIEQHDGREWIAEEHRTWY